MRKINFPSEYYSYSDNSNKFLGDGLVGLFELLWTTVANSPLGVRNGESPLTRKEHKVIKGLKIKLKFISIYKDSDKDSRIIGQGKKEIWLENDEYSLLIRLIEANNISSKVSDTYTDLMDLLDSSQEEPLEPPKLI